MYYGIPANKMENNQPENPRRTTLSKDFYKVVLMTLVDFNYQHLSKLVNNYIVKVNSLDLNDGIDKSVNSYEPY